MKKSTALPVKTSEPVEAASVFLSKSDAKAALPVWLLADGGTPDGLDPTSANWLKSIGFKPTARKQVVVPGPDGSLAGAMFGLGDGHQGDPCGPSELLAGLLPLGLPTGDYRLAGSTKRPDMAALAWGLGAYRFRRYKTGADGPAPARLALPDGVNKDALVNTVEAIWMGRDLINTPASDCGPDDLEASARSLAKRHGAKISVIAGDDLLKHNFPMIHAVGRASPRAPRLIDMAWQKPGGSAKARTITLVGKGITFDTGGLDIKPASGMLIMKKDMGGAATALAVAHMIMGQGLDVKLRVLIAAAENSIDGNAFRPGDILTSRAGKTVEIGNTDAEGRLVLADALALADAESPDTLFTFATLTGAARTALGPDLPALFTDDASFGETLMRVGQDIGDPVWRLPFWNGYDKHLDSDIADINNVWETPFAGAITAALFLRRFVRNAGRFAHLDLYGWRTAGRPLGPRGGEPQTARTVFEVLKAEVTS
jgi:leucyl aminopeptidase